LTVAAPARVIYTVRVRLQEEGNMKNPLDSLWGTVIAGFVLTVILYYIVKSVIGG
jgi:hypothetical protein